MLRLWNLIEGRCVYKTNLSVVKSDEEEKLEKQEKAYESDHLSSEGEELNDDPLAKGKKKAKKQTNYAILKGDVDKNRKPMKVLWNRQGSAFFVLYENSFEIRSV